MNFLIRLLVFLYLIILVMMTIISVVRILSSVLLHELPSKKEILLKIQGLRRA